MNFNNFLTLIVVLSCLLFPLGARGAVLYLEPSAGEYAAGDTLVEEIRVDTEGECINAIDAELRFPADLLEAVDFSKGESILGLWVEDPEINRDSGLISFVGGIPGGYCGRVPGDPGVSNLVGKIIFRVADTSSEQQAKVEFSEDSRVLLNDGKGTPAELTFREAVLNVYPAEAGELPEDEWQEELGGDQTPPEPFVIEVRQDPEIFDGEYYLVFSVVDKQTGIDYCEVLETNETNPGSWEAAESPYLLKDQELQSIIKVKAVDKAGNERVVEVRPTEISVPPEEKPFPWWIILLVAAAGAAAWRLIYVLKERSKSL